MAPAIRSYLPTAFFTAFISRQRDTKTDIIGERGNPCRKRDTAQGRIGPLIPKPTEKGLQSEEIEKRRQRQFCRTEHSIANALQRLPFTCTTAWGLWYVMLIHLQNSDWNPAVSKTDAKKQWSTLSKALDWSKLISAASVQSSIPSITLLIKCRLSWIDLPIIAQVCSGPIRSLITSCKRFAKTRAKIFNSVLNRVMGHLIPPNHACHLSSAMWLRPW